MPVHRTTNRAINPAVKDTSFGFVPGDSAGQVQVPGLTTFSGGLSSANPLLFRWNSWQGYDDVSHTVRKHSLTFGANIERIQDNQFSADTPGGFYQFASLSDFIKNNPQSLLATLPGTITNRNLRQTIFGAYVEDDIRFRPNLTVNLAMHIGRQCSIRNQREAFEPPRPVGKHALHWRPLYLESDSQELRAAGRIRLGSVQ